ncbi:hypothetical protein [Streptomyces nigrescens]|uniref:DUF11 domain-containing protein n=1 Tax=Streptomyces nigrescens TaxID=1920 RepID=A0ABY7IXN8_STRNI|nr:hypothetical protein [Streptomyces nigrescens]WAU03752.1 DUF11 domain-containing protein [Streptomyces nigrescens]
METRQWTAEMVVCGVFASALFSMSGLALNTVGATIASAAAPSCEQSLSSDSAWDHTGGWKSDDGGSTWADSSESLSPESLSRSMSNLPTSGAQFPFDWSWAGMDGASQAAVVTVSYGSTVHAKLVGPGPNVSPRTATVAAGNSASIKLATGPAQRQSTMYTVTLPDDVASSGNLEFGMDRDESHVSAGYVKNVVIDNVKASSTNCADLEISEYGPSAVQPNGTVDYRIYVTNSGPSAVDYTVTDQLPPDFRGATTTTQGCSTASGTHTCTGTSLPVGSTATIGVQATAPGTADSTLTSNARVTGPLTDRDASNNSSSVTTSVDESLGGSLIDSSAAVGAFGAVSLALGITGWRRRASRVDV